MEPSLAQSQRQFSLSPEQLQELQATRKLTLVLNSPCVTSVTLHAEKPIVTVTTSFLSSLPRSGAVLRALNEANKATTVGGFICSEDGEVALKTSTFYPEGMPVPAEQISEIVAGHYGEAIQVLVRQIRTSA